MLEPVLVFVTLGVFVALRVRVKAGVVLGGFVAETDGELLGVVDWEVEPVPLVERGAVVVADIDRELVNVALRVALPDSVGVAETLAGGDCDGDRVRSADRDADAVELEVAPLLCVAVAMAVLCMAEGVLGAVPAAVADAVAIGEVAAAVTLGVAAAAVTLGVAGAALVLLLGVGALEPATLGETEPSEITSTSPTTGPLTTVPNVSTLFTMSTMGDT